MSTSQKIELPDSTALHFSFTVSREQADSQDLKTGVTVHVRSNGQWFHGVVFDISSDESQDSQGKLTVKARHVATDEP